MPSSPIWIRSSGMVARGDRKPRVATHHRRGDEDCHRGDERIGQGREEGVPRHQGGADQASTAAAKAPTAVSGPRSSRVIAHR